MQSYEMYSGNPAATKIPKINSRKINKPLVEKRRRERINASLNQLRALIVDELRAESAENVTKLEKADILETTVGYLRRLQSQQVIESTKKDSSTLNTYRAGYNECMSQVAALLRTNVRVDPELQNRLLNHLIGHSQSVEHLSSTKSQRQSPSSASQSMVVSPKPNSFAPNLCSTRSSLTPPLTPPHDHSLSYSHVITQIGPNTVPPMYYNDVMMQQVHVFSPAPGSFNRETMIARPLSPVSPPLVDSDKSLVWRPW